MAEWGRDMQRRLRLLRFERSLESEYRDHASSERLWLVRLTGMLVVVGFSVPTLLLIVAGKPGSGFEMVGRQVATIMEALLVIVGPVALVFASLYRPWARAALPATVAWFLVGQFWFGIANREADLEVASQWFVPMLHLVLAGFIIVGLRTPFWSAIFYALASWGWTAYLLTTSPALARNRMQPNWEPILLFALGIGFLVLGAYFNEFADRRSFLYRKLLHEEQERLQSVLGNVLPASIAERLKRSNEVIAEYFESATVLFADVVDFTPYARSMEPGQVVGFLNEVFSRFDEVVEKKGLEKIKTVGDAYMVAAGLPEPRPDHLQAIADLALEMRGIAAALGVEMRIGFHSGPVVAGVIGTKKYLYDLWGDTVNIAARMEAFGLPSTIQILDSLADKLGPAYVVAERGEVEVKGLGCVRTSFLVKKQAPTLAVETTEESTATLDPA